MFLGASSGTVRVAEGGRIVIFSMFFAKKNYELLLELKNKLYFCVIGITVISVTVLFRGRTGKSGQAIVRIVS